MRRAGFNPLSSPKRGEISRCREAPHSTLFQSALLAEARRDKGAQPGLLMYVLFQSALLAEARRDPQLLHYLQSAPKRGEMEECFNPLSPKRGEIRSPEEISFQSALLAEARRDGRLRLLVSLFQSALLAEARRDVSTELIAVQNGHVSIRSPRRSEERSGLASSFNPLSSPKRGEIVKIPTAVDGFNPLSSPKRGEMSRFPPRKPSADMFQSALLAEARRDIHNWRSPRRSEERYPR